jgi:hypothetical protein
MGKQHLAELLGLSLSVDKDSCCDVAKAQSLKALRQIPLVSTGTSEGLTGTILCPTCSARR